MNKTTYRRRRKFNKRKFLTFLSVLIVFIALILAVSGKLPFLNRIFGKTNSSTSSASASPSSASATPSSTSVSSLQTATANPTPWPTPEPMPEETTDPAVLDVSWQDPSIFTGAFAYSNEKRTFEKSDGTDLNYWVFQNGQLVDNYISQDIISFGKPSEYSDLKGVTAFRGNNYRDSASFGTRKIKEKKLEIVWSHDLGQISAENSKWPGTGWTGQPLLVNWSEEVRQIMNIKQEMKDKDLTEVICSALDGNIYFLDLENGKPTRNPIKVGFPMKGTGMVDPRGYPIYYTGMGLNENGGKLTEFKYMMFSLIDQKPLYNIMGRDPVAFRKWGAFDSSALIDKNTDTFFEAAENGLIYRVKLNTNFDKEAKTVNISPQLTKYRYKDSAHVELGIENSPTFYKNYMYFCDNGGTLQCLDINTMNPVWTYYVGDDTDSSTVLEETPDGVFLYTANQVDKRSQTSKSTESSNIRKLNALTGELVWQADYSCIYNFYINGGVLGTPLIGKDDINDIIIFPVCFTGSNTDGKLVALDKRTGSEVWSRSLKAYSWSSPVDIRSDDGKTYAIFCDYAGTMHLFDPKTGRDIDTISLGLNIESSPSVYNDMIVVGSYAKKLFGIKIK